MKETLAQKSTYWLKVISLGLILGLGIQFARAWTSPNLSPPTGIVSGPITMGSVSQVKNASLGLSGSLTVGGGVQVGAVIAVCSSTLSGTLRYDQISKCVEYCNGSEWRCMNASASMALPSCVDAFDTPGSYTCQIPQGVNSIKVTGTAGGGSGFRMGPNPGGSWFYSGSGGGGVIDQVVAVTPEEVLTVVVGGVEGPTYLKRGGVSLISLGAGGHGSFGAVAGGSGPLPGQAGIYQPCPGATPKPLSGARNYSAIGSNYGFGGYSACDYNAGVGGSGYLKITSN